MERVIRVTGTGKIAVKPDLTIIDLNFNNTLPTYEDALKASADDVTTIKKALIKAGIDKNSLKTTRFNVDTDYESKKDKNGNYQSVFKGYRYSQSLRFIFDVDNKLLGKILYQLSILSVCSSFRISYGVKDTEAAKNELLGNAVKDAKKKAEVISSAAGVSLGEIVDINYSWEDIEFHTNPYDVSRDYMLASRSYDIDIEPDDIKKSDSVTLTYRII